MDAKRIVLVANSAVALDNSNGTANPQKLRVCYNSVDSTFYLHSEPWQHGYLAVQGLQLLGS